MSQFTSYLIAAAVAHATDVTADVSDVSGLTAASVLDLTGGDVELTADLVRAVVTLWISVTYLCDVTHTR